MLPRHSLTALVMHVTAVHSMYCLIIAFIPAVNTTKISGPCCCYYVGAELNVVVCPWLRSIQYAQLCSQCVIAHRLGANNNFIWGLFGCEISEFRLDIWCQGIMYYIWHKLPPKHRPDKHARGICVSPYVGPYFYGELNVMGCIF